MLSKFNNRCLNINNLFKYEHPTWHEITFFEVTHLLNLLFCEWPCFNQYCVGIIYHMAWIQSQSWINKLLIIWSLSSHMVTTIQWMVSLLCHTSLLSCSEPILNCRSQIPVRQSIKTYTMGMYREVMNIPLMDKHAKKNCLLFIKGDNSMVVKY